MRQPSGRGIWGELNRIVSLSAVGQLCAASVAFCVRMVMVQLMAPFHLKNSAQAADIFQGTWPTTALLRITATA